MPTKDAYTNRTMNIWAFHETLKKQLYTHEIKEKFVLKLVHD